MASRSESGGIVAEELSRSFRVRSTKGGRAAASDLLAVDHLNLNIEPGELFGLLGRNGAGKTTTIRMLSTLLEPTSGRASVAGFDITREPEAVRASIGCVLPGERSHYWKLTARENLRFFAAMYGLEPKHEKSRIEAVLDTVSLSERADERVENYSTGMRQRLSLARALLHNPPVLFLDEPTSGLDVHSARSLRALVKELASSGRTILLTTHNLQEAQELCSLVAIIDRGKMVAVDSPDALRRRSNAADIVEIRCRRSPLGTDGYAHPASAGIARCLAESPVTVADSLLAGSGVEVAGRAGSEDWTVTVKGPRSSSLIPRIVTALADSGWELTACSVKQPNLEDVFVEITCDGDEEVPQDE